MVPTTSESKPVIPQYPVSLWEGLAITTGAVLLGLLAAAGIFLKFINQAVDPQRVLAIANSLADYTLPGGTVGAFGTNIGGLKMAIVTSPTFPRDPAILQTADLSKLSGVELFLAKYSLDIETNELNAELTNLGEPTGLGSSIAHRNGEDFQTESERIENHTFCGDEIPVRVQLGYLILAAQAPPIPAVKYDAVTTFANTRRVATVVAIGPTKTQLADKAFKSLDCK
jgi:hypothetical protein